MGNRAVKQPLRLVVGLTGIFGSGKSAVAKIWKSAGASVIDCDLLAHEVYQPRHPLSRRIKKALRLNTLDRSEIAKLVFKHPSKRRQLEAIIHPYVFRRIAEELRSVRRGVVTIEMPLLFETGFDRQMDCSVLVAAQKKVIRKRLQKKGFSARAVGERWRAQWDLERKKRKADFIINNSGSFSDLKKQATKLLEIWKGTIGVIVGSQSHILKGE